MHEIQRLRALIPPRLHKLGKIDLVMGATAKLLVTRRLERDRWLMQIDLRQWQSLTEDLQNLLFWHELARIEHGSIASCRSTYFTLFIGLGIGVIDLPTQNIGILASALLIAGLAGFRIYQDRWGERHLRQLTTADRAAIELAVEFGYDRATARELLKSALNQTKSSGDRSTRYTARLQVLSLAN